jgi:hypothetical protein
MITIKNILKLAVVSTTLACGLSGAFAQGIAGIPKFEIAGLAGGAKIPDTNLAPVGTETTSVTSPTNFAWQLNLGVPVFHVGPVHAMIEVPFSSVASEKFTTAFNQASTGSLVLPASGHSAYFLTPGLRVRLFNRGIAPFAAVGFGLESTPLIHGSAVIASDGSSGVENTVVQRNYRGVFDVAGGVDYSLLHFLALRGEVRDFIRTGSVSSSTGTAAIVQDITQSRNTVAFLAGVVVRF